MEDTRALIESAHGGSAVAAEELFRRYYSVALRVAELRLGQRLCGRHEAEDVVQESLLDAFQALEGFRWTSEGSFRNWLACIIENNLRDLDKHGGAMKRGGGRVRLEADLTESSLSACIFRSRDATPSQRAIGAELEERIEWAMRERLGAPYREVILLRDLCGMEYDEVARAMGYASAATVRSMHARATRKLEDVLRTEDA